MKNLISMATLVAACGCAISVQAQVVFPEVEPNDGRAAANGPFVMATGDSITGSSTGQVTSGGGANTMDWFIVQPTAARTAGIYQHRIVMTSNTLTQRMQIPGRSQFDSFPSSADASVCFDATTGAGLLLHAVGWYGFGQSEPIVLSVFGAATSTQPYTLTLTTTPVTPIDMGTMPGGMMTVSSVGETTADTDFWVYDANFQPVPGFGNDDLPDAVAHTVLQSQMSKDVLAPGAYYVAISDYNLSNNQLSPVGDRYPSKAYLDYPGVVSQMGVSNSAANVNVSFKVVDGAGVEHHQAATKVGSYDIIWAKLTVTAPATGACCKPDGICIVASPSGCAGLYGGAYQGDGVVCGACTQPPQGACCLLDGTCVQSSSSACVSYSGAWHGAGSACGGCPGTLEANPHVENGAGGFSGAGGVFVDITASGGHAVQISRFDYYATQSYNNATPLPVIDVYFRPTGTSVGAEFGASNTQTPPPNDWQLITTVTTSPYPVGSSFTALPVVFPNPVTIPQGAGVGFYLVVRAGGIKAASVGDFIYSNADLTLQSERGRTFTAANAPGWATSLTNPRTFVGRVFYSVVTGCYANCDGSTVNPILNANDFQCFLNSFAAGESYANCDGSTVNPIFNANDFQCFLNAFAAGCP